LTELLKGSKNGKKSGLLQWGASEAQAFRTICDAFTRAPILAYFDPARKTRLETDASGSAAGAVVSQLWDASGEDA
jgi:hypothetical protein